MQFRDRTDAGRRLAAALTDQQRADPLVLGLPRGGVPVAAGIASALGVPVDVFVARKIGAPGHEELGVGAVAEGSEDPVFSDAGRRLGLPPERLGELAARERQELRRRVARYRGARPLPDPFGRDVVLVDDGLATGVTAEAALLALRARQPHRLTLAVPVGAREAVDRLAAFADEVVCLLVPRTFLAVGEWYEDFAQVTDEEVLAQLVRPG